MNVWHRINARKIMFSYLYTDFFYRAYNAKKLHYSDQERKPGLHSVEIEWEHLQNSDQQHISGDTFLSELNIQAPIEDIDEWDNVQELSLDEHNDLDFSIIANGLRIDLDEVDRDYITAIRDHYKAYEAEVEKLVNPLLTQFQWNDLEAIKKAIFILWYTEYKVLATDVKVIINEVIELAKRFGGTDVYKLVNGVFHTLLMWEKE